MKNIIKYFSKYIIVSCLFYTNMLLTQTYSVQLVFESGFLNNFESGAVWANVNSESVKSIIISRVSDDFSPYGIEVRTDRGSIKAYIGLSNNDYYGLAITGIGSFTDPLPYVEIYSNKFGTDENFQGSKATASRIGEAIAGTTSHELGHIFNLYHAYMFDSFDPITPGALNSNYEPVEADNLPSSCKDPYARNHLMATIGYITMEERATINRYWGLNENQVLSIAVSGGGDIWTNTTWNLSGRTFTQRNNINITPGITFIIAAGGYTHDLNGYNIIGGIIKKYGNMAHENANVSNGSIYKSILTNLTSNVINNSNPGDIITVNSGSHILSQNNSINSNVTLTINSGASLYFSPTTSLLVNGIINASGAIFQGNGSRGSWGGITIQSAGSSILNSNIRDAENGITTYNIYPGISFNRFTNCNIGVNCITYSSPNIVSNNIFSGNNWDVYGDVTSVPNLGSPGYGGYNSFRNPGYYQVYSLNSNATINACGNYWSSGPIISSNVNAWSPLQYDPNPLQKKAIVRNGENPILQKLLDNNTAITTNKESPEKTKLDNANTLFFTEKYIEALPIYETIVNDNPDNLTGEIALVFMERCLEKLGRKSEIIEKLNTLSLDKSGKKISTFAELRKVYQMRLEGETDNAIIQAKSVLKIANDSTHLKMLLFELGNLYYNEKKEKSDGETYFRELIKRYPDDILSELSLMILGEWKPKIKDEQDKPIAKISSEIISAELSNYPNPFNPITTINYSLPKNGYVTIKVYDAIGREVKTLISENKSAGSYLAIFNAMNLSSGIYFYRMNFQPNDGTKAIMINKSMRLVK